MLSTVAGGGLLGRGVRAFTEAIDAGAGTAGDAGTGTGAGTGAGIWGTLAAGRLVPGGGAGSLSGTIW
ncbi:MAG: hypothetical protein WBM48_16885, partial [Polyangiales bacterium]